MKILFQCPRYLPEKGGIQISTHKLAKYLIKQGHDVYVLAEKSNLNLKSFEIIEGVRVYRFPKPEINATINFISFFTLQKTVKKEMKQLLKQNKFDIIISRAFFFIKPTKKVYNGPVIYIQPSVGYIAMKKSAKNSPIKRKFNRYFKMLHSYSLEKSALNLADRVLCRSNAMRYINEKSFGIPKRKMGEFTQIADLKRFSPKKKNALLIKKLGVRNKKVILCVSRLSPDKNNYGLIKLMPLIDKNISLVLVGDGPQMSFLKQKAKELGVSKRVSFVGEKENTWSYYNIADIFVTLSEQEGFPNVFLEAMSSGLPVIGLKECPPKITIPTKEFVQDKKIGFAVKNEKEMAEKIDLLLKDDKLREMMGKQARKEAEKYSKKIIGNGLLKEIKKLV